MALPTQQPTSSWGNYYGKFKMWENRFRIVTDIVWWYVVRDKRETPNKPVRSEKNDLSPIWDQRPKCFWIMWVLDRDDNDSFKILELDKASIIKALTTLDWNKDRWDAKGYDVVVTREWEWIKTKYSLQPIPPKALTKEEKEILSNNPVELENVFIDWASMFLDADDMIADEEPHDFGWDEPTPPNAVVSAPPLPPKA